MADDKTRRVPVPDNRDHRRQPSLPLYLNAHPRVLIHMTDIVLSIGHRKVCAQPEAGNCLILPASFMLRPVTTLLDIARDESAVFLRVMHLQSSGIENTDKQGHPWP